MGCMMEVLCEGGRVVTHGEPPAAMRALLKGEEDVHLQ